MIGFLSRLLGVSGSKQNDLNSDIPESRRAEQRERESQGDLRVFLTAARVATWDWDIRTGQVKWSEDLDASHGRRPAAFEGTIADFMKAIRREDQPIVERAFAQAIEQSGEHHLEFRVHDTDGEFHWLAGEAHVLRDDAGAAVRMTGTCVDVTERRKADERFRLAVEASPSGIILVNNQGCIVLVNSQVTRSFGYEPEELHGQPVEMLIPERFRARHVEHRAEFYRQPKARPMGMGQDLFAVRKDGTEFQVEISLTPIDTDEGPLVLGTIVDITTRKQLEAERLQLLASERVARSEAERANSLKDVFLATVSHELRTPLNAILGWSQRLGRAKLEGEAAQAVVIIERNARLQAHLIEDLLDSSRIVSGKIRIDMEAVELPSVIDSAVETVRPLVESRSIRLEKAIDLTAGPVSGDPNRLQQVVWNLLSNAVKFTPRGGMVRVSLNKLDSHVEIVVSDSGPGIRPEFLPHLFDRFSQAVVSTTQPSTGLGLGLYIVKQLLDLHGGTVRGENAGEGTGAIFTVCLPLAGSTMIGKSVEKAEEQTSSVATETAPLVADRQTLTGIKVLMVDDEPDACMLVQCTLEEYGATVTTAKSAAEALDLLDPFDPDVILSDIGMPGQDGYQFMRTVRSREAVGARTRPAAALTAFCRSEDRARALIAGYQTHIGKPVTSAELIAVVASLTGRIVGTALAEPPP